VSYSERPVASRVRGFWRISAVPEKEKAEAKKSKVFHTWD
jgi:hypothetical protein